MTHFNKRHYQAIAAATQRTIRTRTNNSENVAGVWQLVSEMADLFETDNSLFKRDLFLQACQPGANVRARKVA